MEEAHATACLQSSTRALFQCGTVVSMLRWAMQSTGAANYFLARENKATRKSIWIPQRTLAPKYNSHHSGRLCLRSHHLNLVVMSENVLFENSFKITDLNNSKYDRVSRIKAYSENGQEVLLTLDVNTELYPLNVDDRMTVALALSLNLDGSKDDGKGWREVGRGEQTLADEYDYVCHGKIYRFEEGTGDNM